MKMGGGPAGRLALLSGCAFALVGCFSSSSGRMADIRTTAAPSAVAMAALAADENPYSGRAVELPVLPKASAPPAEPADTQVQVTALAPPPPPSLATLPAGEGIKRLVGLDRAALEALLGSPWLLKHEAAAELWQYRAPNCVLDLFLYAKADGELRVTLADLRGRRENRPAPAGCFAEIVGGTSQKAEAVKG